MICPYCNHEFPLTWSRYLRSPFGKHVCAKCGKRSRLKLTRPYLVAMTTILIAVLLLVVVLTKVVLRRFWPNSEYLAVYTIATVLAIVLIVVPLDRFCEEQMKPLEKLPEEEA